jgi:predicted Rossmann fold flavoprotein
MLMMREVDVVVLGAGAAGLMAAIAAGRRGRRVVVLDHADAAGKKILISGGGRCNFTNLDCRPDRFLSANPHFARSALARYTQHDFIALVRRHGIAFHEKTLGQLFCDGSAREIVAMLLAECAAVGAEVLLDTRVTEVSRADRFNIATTRGAFTPASLVLATGGLSIPKMGATGLSLDLARRFGLPVVETRPALVPLHLRGRSARRDAAARRRGAGRHREGWPRSVPRGVALHPSRPVGPAILQASSYWRRERR